MYSYAKNQRLNLLKMQFQDAYEKHIARLDQVEKAGQDARNQLARHYEDRLVAMQHDEDRLRRLHADVMRKMRAQSDRLAMKLQLARERANQAARIGGDP